MKFNPLADRVLIQKDKRANQSPGGIIIPENADEERAAFTGTVRAVGPGSIVEGRRIEPSIKTGDRVVFGKYAGTEIEVDGERLLIVREDDVLGFIEH